MKIEQLIKEYAGEGQNISGLISGIQGTIDRNFKPLDKRQVENAINPKRHDVYDEFKRKNKKVKIEVPNPADPDNPTIEEKPVQVNRVGLAMQRLIVEQAVAVMFSNDPKLVFSSDSDEEKKFYKAMEKVLSKIRSNRLNKDIARQLYQTKEVAEIWYLQPGEHRTYGFKSKNKYRVKVCSPYLGDTLYPIFDSFGDMIAFAREYSETRSALTVNYLEIFTDEEIVVFWNGGGQGANWVEKSRSKNLIGKIPVVYSRQEFTEWEFVEGLINRLETILSNFADTNDYHASPKIFVEGKITGFAQKGETGAVLEGEAGTKAEYLSWDNAPESVKFEVATLIGNISKLSQTPDFSLENIKGLSTVSGVALKLLFMDSHLKAKNKEEIFDPHLSRRASIIASMMEYDAAGEFKDFDFSTYETFNEFRPFIIQDIKELVETLNIATNGKQIMSRKTAVQVLDMSADVQEEIINIENDEKLDVFEDVN